MANDVWDEIENKYNEVSDAVKETYDSAKEKYGDVVSDTLNEIENKYNQVSNSTKETYDKYSGIVIDKYNEASDAVSNYYNQASTLANDYYNQASNLINDVNNTYISPALEIAHDQYESAKNQVVQLTTSLPELYDAAAQELSDARDYASDKLSHLVTDAENEFYYLMDTNETFNHIYTGIDEGLTWVSDKGSEIIESGKKYTQDLMHIVEDVSDQTNINDTIRSFTSPEYERAVFDIYQPKQLQEVQPQVVREDRSKNLFNFDKVDDKTQSNVDANYSIELEQQRMHDNAAISKARRAQAKSRKTSQNRLTPVPKDNTKKDGHTLRIKDHYATYRNANNAEVLDQYGRPYPNTPRLATKNHIAVENGERFATIEDHMHYDRNEYASPAGSDNHSKYGYQSNGMKKFQGSSTPLYTEQDSVRKDIFGLEDGLYLHEKKFDDGKARKLSVLDTFFRPDKPWYPQYANYFAYNRTKLPAADLEWRKGFRHIFITRPECYIMSIGGDGLALSEQCQNDETFYTSYTRMPHISYLLSPSYITNNKEGDPNYKDNFNYLLTNRIMGLSVLGTEIDQVQSVQKSTLGATVMPGGCVSNDFGNQLSLNFRDTKNLEVYECLRLWMRYISNIYCGLFASSFNGYLPENNYNFSGYIGNGEYIADTGVGKIPITKQRHLHPYDRALDYCCTIFDIVTNETGTKVLYWCKYIGAYPISAQLGSLTTSQMNEPIVNEQQCSARFYYQGKEEYTNRSFVEFNFNAGLVDEVGNPGSTQIKESLPFLLREDYTPFSELYRNTSYLGASSMWTGRPYIVLGTNTNHVLGVKTFSPYLRFMKLQDVTANEMNAGITHDRDTTTTLMAMYS